MKKVVWIIVGLGIVLSGLGLWNGFTKFLAVGLGWFVGIVCFRVSSWLTEAVVGKRVKSNRPVFLFGMLKWFAIGGGFALIYALDHHALVWYFLAVLMVYFLLVVGALFDGVAPTTSE